ncbi:hypothetical protein Tco_1100905 [Tanacetum coccineum]
MKKLLIAASEDSMLSAKVMTIEEPKDLATLPLDVLVGNRKVYEMILENNGVVSKTTIKDKVKSLVLQANVTREKTSNDNDSQDESDEDVDEEEKSEAFNLLARNFRKFFHKGGESSMKKGSFSNCGIEGHFASECRESNENKAFVARAWSDSEDGNEPQNEGTCLMAIDSQEILDSGCTKRRLFTSYKSYHGGYVIFGSNLKGKVVNGGPFTSQSSEIVERTHRKSLPEPKSSSSVEDDRINEPTFQDLNGSPLLQVNRSDEGYPKSLKEARDHPIKHVIGELNE